MSLGQADLQRDDGISVLILDTEGEALGDQMKNRRLCKPETLHRRQENQGVAGFDSGENGPQAQGLSL